MVKNYSTGFAVKNSRKKKAVRKNVSNSKSKEFFSATKLMWKSLGAMLLVTVVIGTTSSIWYGWQVQQALDQIGKGRIINIELTNENRLLVAQYDRMLTREHMEKAAEKIGLYTPTEKQLRYP